jgi:5-methylcytosine-specific restriction endonuclease McrA
VAYSPDPFVIEHILPRSRGGSHRAGNLAFSCQGCNGYKYTATEAVDPVSGEVVPLYHPRRDRWKAHFAWNDTYTHIVGQTPTGRATVARLGLNRPHVVNLRHLLISIAEHPPEATSTEAESPLHPPNRDPGRRGV